MIVDDLHLVCSCLSPWEAYAKLLIDSNAMLPLPISLQSLEAITWRHCKIA
jgi:hypothetical protein